jgi:hypothetical protein
MPVLDPLERGDQWPFNWSTVNVPGSPGLSRLFTALELEESSPVPELSLSDAEVETSQTFSAIELSDIFNEKNKRLVYNVDVGENFQRHNDIFDVNRFPGETLTRHLWDGMKAHWRRKYTFSLPL